MLRVARFLLAAIVASAAPGSGASESGPRVSRAPDGNDGVQSTEGKPAWEWTLEERLAKRFDPLLIAEREVEYWASPSSAGAQPDSARDTAAPSEKGTVLIIDGERHPELFLPHELFDVLMGGFNPDAELRDHQRESFRVGIAAFGFDQDLFWSQLLSVASPYADYKYRTITSRRESNDKCRARFDALNAARQLFGRDRFDQFLYQVVAPGTWFSSATNATDPSGNLRRIVSGCS